MNNNENPFKNVRVEYHILQSFPVSCLNRDDVNSPKTAQVGGVTRARVSSQCWKRQVRLALREFGIVLGSRTKLISTLIGNACKAEGATETQAKECGDLIENIFIKKAESAKKSSDKKETDKEDTAVEDTGKSDTLLFFAPAEVSLIAKKFKEKKFKPKELIIQSDAKKQAKELAEIIGKQKLENAKNLGGLDIALFGRMVAQAAELNIEAAASFSHAISTHEIANEEEFFTALDDNSTEQGSAHMGSLEFNSATYYRYISLNLGQLYSTLGSGEFIPQAIDAFTKALYIAVPSARQTTQSGASPWEYAKVFVRKGQRLQVPFEAPVKNQGGGFLEPSIEYLKNYIGKQKKLAGSLFGNIAEFDFGDDENFSIDHLVAGIQKAARVK
ncbi:type I-E CRISPR-associated protein Cas7/Cse4/CasC [Treponema primitia]|uniref:type I-E CRISPR-associated protein Cas7/Cse4/CasC n=1 Tax=Treponema primitia TaxID=88058 RepID=UPI0002554C55|nr:type I-E CRISPR-associated protein Cas7/Cse4/CasC [Treponema primitia]